MAKMTTIAWDGLTLAADRQITDCGVRVTAGWSKIYGLPDGRVVAFCGDVFMIARFMRWLADGENGDPPTGDYAALVIASRRDAREFCVSTDPAFSWGWFPARPPAGLGSGGHFALSAMLCGKTAAEAVRHAIRLDVYSGGRVDVVEIGGAR